jgi:hypothetical protein
MNSITAPAITGYRLVKTLTGTQGSTTAESEKWLRDVGSTNLDGDARQYRYQKDGHGAWNCHLYVREDAARTISPRSTTRIAQYRTLDTAIEAMRETAAELEGNGLYTDADLTGNLIDQLIRTQAKIAKLLGDDGDLDLISEDEDADRRLPSVVRDASGRATDVG